MYLFKCQYDNYLKVKALAIWMHFAEAPGHGFESINAASHWYAAIDRPTNSARHNQWARRLGVKMNRPLLLIGKRINSTSDTLGCIANPMNDLCEHFFGTLDSLAPGHDPDTLYIQLGMPVRLVLDNNRFHAVHATSKAWATSNPYMSVYMVTSALQRAAGIVYSGQRLAARLEEYGTDIRDVQRLQLYVYGAKAS
jgi:hypothetical protein